MDKIIIFTDGSCLGNPGSGGWAAVLRHGSATRELSGGFRRTTNNRMEIIAVLEGLSALRRPCEVDLYTDSQYVSKAISQSWLDNWQKNGWRNARKEPVKNQDLWRKMSDLLSTHKVKFHWLKGHAGHPENERCDELARSQAIRADLPEDVGYVGDGG